MIKFWISIPLFIIAYISIGRGEAASLAPAMPETELYLSQLQARVDESEPPSGVSDISLSLVYSQDSEFSHFIARAEPEASFHCRNLGLSAVFGVTHKMFQRFSIKPSPSFDHRVLETEWKKRLGSQSIQFCEMSDLLTASDASQPHVYTHAALIKPAGSSFSELQLSGSFLILIRMQFYSHVEE
jgi:hypothetical protein